MGTANVFAISSEPSTLTVIMECGGKPLEGIDVAICRVADVEEKGANVIYKATPEFAAANADFTDLTKEKNIILALSLNTFAYANNINRISGTTNGSGAVIFKSLPAGLYLVTQMNAESSEYIIAPYLVSVPVMNETTNKWEYDVTAYPKTEPVKRDDGTTSVSVYKVWAGTTTVPAQISVQLYKNGVAHGNRVILGPGNHWIHTWTNLSSGDTWTVDEFDVPDGYIKTISGSASTGFVITNTKNGQTTNKTDDSNRPKMGDEMNIRLWVTLTAFSIIGLLAVYFANIIIQRRRIKR